MKLTAGQYLEMILKKMNITQAELVRRINNCGIGKWRLQNINNVIHDHLPLGVQRAREIEIALKLEPNTLTIVASDYGQYGSKKTIEKVNERARELNLI